MTTNMMLIKQYAAEDFKAVAERCKSKYDLDVSISNLEYDCDEHEVNHADESSCIVIATLEVEGTKLEFALDYVLQGDNIYVGGDIVEWAADLKHKYDAAVKGVQAATRVSSRRIVAAEEDLIEEPDTFTDTLDELADNVEDVQDQVSEIEEDDVNIDVNNNIEGHYIAECDTCHGVFISAVIESDQEVEKISGICPLCNKETDQYLKWIVKPADHSE